MLDWLKYFPFAARWVNYPKSVKGPYFSCLRPTPIVFGDSVLTIKLPRSNHVYGLGRNTRKVENKDLRSDNLLYGNWNGVGWDSISLNHWQHHFFLKKEWLFVGEWFSSAASRLILFAHILGKKNSQDFEGSSFFHPRVFESAIANYLDAFYGHDKNGRNPMYRGPLNWTILNVSDTIKAVLCDIHVIGNTGKDNPKLKRLIFVPLAHDRLLKLTLDHFGTFVHSNEPKDKAVFALCDSIINTISLKLGPQTLEQWNSVQKSCPDMSITETFGELKWPIKPEDIGKTASLPEQDFSQSLPKK